MNENKEKIAFFDLLIQPPKMTLTIIMAKRIPQNVPMIQITNTNQNKVDINISFGTVRVLLNVSKLLRTA